jgi:hypothetical protein
MLSYANFCRLFMFLIGRRSTLQFVLKVIYCILFRHFDTFANNGPACSNEDTLARLRLPFKVVFVDRKGLI